jgi:hypothetical protein
MIKSQPDKYQEKYKTLLEAEKLVDKERKQIRYERKKRQDLEIINEKKSKVEKRMNR